MKRLNKLAQPGWSTTSGLLKTPILDWRYCAVPAAAFFNETDFYISLKKKPLAIKQPTSTINPRNTRGDIR